MLLGAVGLGYFVYGRRNAHILSLACGLALMVFPSFIAGLLPRLLLGIGLMAVPFLVSFG